MTVTDDAPVLVVRKEIAVPRERVFAAWLDSESLVHWMRPGNFGPTVAVVDPRVGGGFRVAMTGSAHETVEHWGEYLAIEPPSLLSFTWISRNTDQLPTVVTIEFFERGAGTELVLTHRGLPPRAVEGHRWGWSEIVELLAAELAQG